MNRFIPVILLLIFPLTSSAQKTAKYEVMEVIETMFDGMRANDGDMVASVFADGATLNSSGSRDGTPFVRSMTATDFAGAVRGGAGGPSWDERIWDVEIEVKDNLATAWMDYAFYAGETFSHCGANAMHLARTSEGNWKIVALADTRVTGRCMINQDKLQEAMVRTALRHYLRGHATGLGSEHEQAFNDIANLYWMRDGELNTRSSEAYIAGASGSPSENEAERTRYIEWVDVAGTAAMGKIVLDYPGAYIVDYMQLLKIDGRWQIVNKIFDVDGE